MLVLVGSADPAQDDAPGVQCTRCVAPGLIASLPRAFVLLWAAQLVSNLGTQVSLYALGLWLYQQHNQLATFAAVAIAVQLAKLLVLPLLGRHLARWPRRRVMLIANAVGCFCTLLLAWQLLRWGASPPLVLGCIAVAAAAEATLLLCFSSLIPQLVPREQLGAASGLFASAD
ncbi:MAG: MFS transporter, partial [Cyanobacteria bacterium M_surface_7_m2_040]|nr:MFS transporter [Cyanobacteria bacterium M_surface_7_m2_040]